MPLDFGLGVCEQKPVKIVLKFSIRGPNQAAFRKKSPTIDLLRQTTGLQLIRGVEAHNFDLLTSTLQKVRSDCENTAIHSTLRPFACQWDEWQVCGR